MSTLKKAIDAVEKHPNTTSSAILVVAVGIYWWFCDRVAKSLEQDRRATPCITFTAKQ